MQHELESNLAAQTDEHLAFTLSIQEHDSESAFDLSTLAELV